MLVAFIQRAVVQGIPLLFGSTGEILTEKSGNLNLGTAGVMYVGGITGVIGAFLYEQNATQMNTFLTVLIPILSSILGSLVMGLIYSFLTVTLRANQNVTGLALTTFGVGFGKSRQKYLYLPEPQNDFIFSILCEELGFLGACAVILLFSALLGQRNAPETAFPPSAGFVRSFVRFFPVFPRRSCPITAGNAGLYQLSPRETESTMPISPRSIIRLVPPEEKNGRLIPVLGMVLVTTAMFSTACRATCTTKPTTSSRYSVRICCPTVRNDCSTAIPPKQKMRTASVYHKKARCQVSAKEKNGSRKTRCSSWPPCC